MHSDSETWERPPVAAYVRNPEAVEAWRRRVDAWSKANPQLSAEWDEAHEENHLRDEQNEKRREEARRLTQSQAPARAVDAWKAGLRPTAATSAVRSFLASGKAFLLLCGSPGSGKTVAAIEMLARLSGPFVRAVHVSRISSFERNEKEWFENICWAPSMVLDDLGAEMLHDGWRPLLDELIDIRYGDQLKTIITTNLDQEAFKARYGERIADRIRHDGQVVSCGDKSMRGRTA